MDRQEALERSQTGEKPEGGYYTSSERISLRNFGLGRITRISSSKFTGNRGGAGGGRGGAIVPLTRAIDSSELVPTAQTPQVDPNLVSSLQKQINALTTRDEQQLALNNNIIGTLQNQFQVLQTKVVDLGNQLLGVKTALISDSNLEQKKELEEKVLQNREAEQQYRTDKENLIEKKIVSALMAPIQAIGQRVQFTLGRVMEFFTILFSGWLFDKAIETFRALSSGNTEKLENIKNSVLKNLAIVGGILLLLNGGFLAISRTIASLSLSVGSFLLKNTIGKFFGLLGNAAKGLLNIGKVPAAAAAAGVGAAGAGAAAGGKPPTAGGKPGGGFLGGISKFFTGASGVMDLASGQNVDAPGALKIPFAAAYTLDAVSEMFGGNLLGKNPNEPATSSSISRPITPTTTTTSPPPPSSTPSTTNPSPVNVTPTSPVIPPPQVSSPPPTPVTAPSVNMVPPPMEFSFNPNKETPSEEVTVDFSKPAEFGEISIPGVERESKVPGQAEQISSVPSSSPSISPAQTQRIPTSTPTIGQEPEAKPNVVYMSSGGGQPQMPQMSERSGAASEVPSISSGNPDNFYLLYSQVSYNIVT
jgi:hypothetical protein